MSNEKNHGAMWRAKARARRELVKPSITGPVDLGDGCEFIGRRLDLASWLKGGRIPQSLTEQMIRIDKGVQDDIVEEALSAEETIAALRFQRELVTQSVVDPVIVDDTQPELAEGEIYWSEIFGECPEWVDKIAMWQIKGAPGIGVEMVDGGVIELSELAQFRNGSGGETAVVGGADWEELRDPPGVSLLGIIDETVAFDLDMAAATAVERHTQQIENNRAEAMVNALAASALGGLGGLDREPPDAGQDAENNERW